jgi:predicted HTH domain antitoxin
MNALQSVEPPSYNPPKSRQKRHPKQQTKRHTRSDCPRGSGKADRALAIEIAIKLIANGVLSIAALAALVKLLPYQFLQQAKLQEIRLEVNETEAEVKTLRSNFNRYFDPTQAKKVMQEQSPRLEPNQRRIVLMPSQ